MSWSGATVSALTIQYAGLTSQNILAAPLPATIALPVGAALAATFTGTPSALAFLLAMRILAGCDAPVS